MYRMLKTWGKKGTLRGLKDIEEPKKHPSNINGLCIPHISPLLYNKLI